MEREKRPIHEMAQKSSNLSKTVRGTADALSKIHFLTKNHGYGVRK